MTTSMHQGESPESHVIRILLIEDNPLDAELFREFLADSRLMPFDLVHAECLEPALNKLARNRFDVIFLDFKLPDSDGFDSLRRLTAHSPTVPIIMLTGLDDDDIGLEAVQLGAQDYLVKGEVDQRTIWRVLRHAMARKHIEDQLREQQAIDRRLQQAGRAESLMVLAGGIAHEYNNLLTGIIGNTSLALTELESASPTRALLHEIQIAAQRATQLSNQMLTYSGKANYREQGVDLGQLLRDMAPLLNAAVSPHARLSFSLPTDPLPVLGDPAQLQQVLINLVSNASDAIGSEPGEVTISAGVITVHQADDFDQGSLPLRVRPGPCAQIIVADTGCGMTPTTLNRIFDPFFSTKFVGRGLGLASVAGILRGHHGAVRVTSEPYKGTAFAVVFPLHRAPQTAAPSHDQPSTAGHRWQGHGTVLVVDEEELILSMVRKILEACALRVRIAAGSTLALEQIQAAGQDLDLLIVDVAMSRGGNECGLLNALADISPQTPVLVTSGMTPEDVARRLGTHHTTAFLQKPYSPTDLIQKVRSLLE